MLQDLTSGYGTTLIVKTTAFPALTICSGDNKERDHPQLAPFKATLPGRAIVAQLNAAQRFLGQEYGFHIVDVEAMLSSLGDASTYLRDTHHTNNQVNHEVLNMFLNLHHQAHVSQRADGERS